VARQAALLQQLRPHASITVPALSYTQPSASPVLLHERPEALGQDGGRVRRQQLRLRLFELAVVRCGGGVGRGREHRMVQGGCVMRG
jgi:hypothetical protein